MVTNQVQLSQNYAEAQTWLPGRTELDLLFYCIISTVYRLYHATVAVLVTIWSFCF